MSTTKTRLPVAAVVAGVWGLCASVAGEDAPAAAPSPGEILALAKNLRGAVMPQTPRAALLAAQRA